MTSPLPCHESPAACGSMPLAVVLQPVMAYTRRAVGYEVKCSLPWGADPECVQWHDDRDRFLAHPQTLFAAQAGKVPPIFAVPLSMGAERCAAFLPAGSLLLLELPEGAPTGQAELHVLCAALKAAGFQVGIAHYNGEPCWSAALPLISHIRLQYARTLSQRQKEWLKGPLRRSVLFIADGVETEVDLTDAMQQGFQLFQGAFAHRIARLQWTDAELQLRALLLQRACDEDAVTVGLLQDVLGCGNLTVRFGTLLKATGNAHLSTASSPEVVAAALGEERLQQLLQISLAQEMAGCGASTLLCRLFLVARFHELMRAFNLAAPSRTARFEGIILGTLAAVRGASLDDDTVHHASVVLKHSVGLPMDCSAFYRNHAIADAYLHARWHDAEQLALHDGYTWSTVNRLYQEATAWAHRYVQSVLA